MPEPRWLERLTLSPLAGRGERCGTSPHPVLRPSALSPGLHPSAFILQHSAFGPYRTFAASRLASALSSGVSDLSARTDLSTSLASSILPWEQ